MADARPTPLARSVLVYACAFAVAGATPFVLLPILTRHLSPQQFGEVTAFLLLAAMVANLAGLSSHGFVSVRFFKSAPDVFRRLVTGSAFAVCAAHAAAAMIVVASYPLLRRAFELSLPVSLCAVVAGLFLSLNLVCLAIFQSSGRPMLYLTSRLVQGAGEIALCIALLFSILPGSESRMVSFGAALALASAFGLIHCARNAHLGGRPAAADLRQLAAFGIPMLPHIAAGTAITYLDRVMVSSLLGVESLGIYMVAMQIGMAMIAVIEPVNKALAPWLFSQLARNDAQNRELIVRRTYLFQAALVLVGVAVATGALLFFDAIVDARYAAAKALIPWMVAGYVLQGMYYTVVNYMFFAERTGRLSVMSTLTAVAGCFVSYGMISRFGLVGAGASFVLNNAILFGLVWFAASQVVSMPWRLNTASR